MLWGSAWVVAPLDGAVVGAGVVAMAIRAVSVLKASMLTGAPFGA